MRTTYRLADHLQAVACVAVLVALAGLNACAARSGSVERRIAVTGITLIESADNALTSIERLHASGTLSDQNALQAIAVIEQVGVHASQLADVLRIIDDENATEVQQQSAMQSARSIMRAVQRLLTEGAIPVGDPADRERIGAILGVVSGVLIDLAVLI